jgi:hypothetical protein
MNKETRLLIETLQGAGAEEVRLYRSGKLPGLFAARTSANGELAALALRDGLIEIVRTETKGKTSTEWVKVTAKGTQFLVEQENPVKVLEELHALLRQNQEGLPTWLADMQSRLAEANHRLLEEFQTMTRRLDRLAQRVVEALQRAERMGPALPEGAAGALPWSNEAVSYLERRSQTEVGEMCPLPELFAVVRKKEPALTIHDFHSGLRRLHDRGVLRLLTCDDPAEPEYALLDGPTMYYYAAPRSQTALASA